MQAKTRGVWLFACPNPAVAPSDRMSWLHSFATECMVDQKQHDTTYKSHKNAPQIDARDPISAESTEDDSTDNSANNSEDDIAHQSFARLVDNPARQKPAYQSHHDPRDDTGTLRNGVIGPLSKCWNREKRTCQRKKKEVKASH